MERDFWIKKDDVIFDGEYSDIVIRDMTKEGFPHLNEITLKYCGPTKLKKSEPKIKLPTKEDVNKALGETKRINVCEKAIETFGVIAQLDQAQEEAAELITAISKYKRALESKDFNKMQCRKSDILLELADTAIMQKQLLILTGYTHDDLQLAVKSKLKKLYSHIEKGVK